MRQRRWRRRLRSGRLPRPLRREGHPGAAGQAAGRPAGPRDPRDESGRRGRAADGAGRGPRHEPADALPLDGRLRGKGAAGHHARGEPQGQGHTAEHLRGCLSIRIRPVRRQGEADTGHDLQQAGGQGRRAGAGRLPEVHLLRGHRGPRPSDGNGRDQSLPALRRAGEGGDAGAGVQADAVADAGGDPVR